MKKDRQLGGKLFALAGVDQRAVEVGLKKKELEGRRSAMVKELERRREILADTEADVAVTDKLRAQEESLLAAEENKILERRKQLQGIGGAKAAKIIEKEIEITARSLQVLEERVTSALSAIEISEKRLAMIKSAVDELSGTLSSGESEFTSQVQQFDVELLSLKKEREVILKEVSKTDDRVITLYERIRTRFPGDPVAVASGGSCRSCYRSLPNQLFNTILAGNTRIQCPGCSRLLVLGREDSGDKAA